MTRKAISMRGETVDFDLFTIKEQISAAPPTETIQRRERFIAVGRRRGTKRKIQDMLAEQEASKKSVVESLKADTAVADSEEPSAASEPTKRKIKKDA